MLESIKANWPRLECGDRVSARLSNPLKPEVKIFSGHLGVGKSSELLRLKGNLENPTSGRAFRVILADVERSLDLNDLDFPDLLVFLAAEIQRDLRAAKIPGFSGTSTLLADQWDRLRSALGAKFDLTGADPPLEVGGRPSGWSLPAERRRRKSVPREPAAWGAVWRR